MPLPPPGLDVTWKDYRIDTPTFQLTPLEKPDMSPFLVHMTGKDEIISILKGENASEKITTGHGVLKASVPQTSQGSYSGKVVCFTESPTFALDFFRYRSYQRWSKDQRFGLGFDKTNLIALGIRPVVYLDSNLVTDIINLHRYIQKNHRRVSDDDDFNSLLVQSIGKIYPLLFPLLEGESKQGFMWEREWRATDSNGFVFNHDDIRIICCPQEEEQIIREILGTSANNVQFIRVWREYDDVTQFLKRQQKDWQILDESVQAILEEDKKVQQLDELIQQHQIAKNSLISYQEFVTRLGDDQEKIKTELEVVNQRIITLQKQRDNLGEEKL